MYSAMISSLRSAKTNISTRTAIAALENSSSSPRHLRSIRPAVQSAEVPPLGNSIAAIASDTQVLRPPIGVDIHERHPVAQTRHASPRDLVLRDPDQVRLPGTLNVLPSSSSMKSARQVRSKSIVPVRNGGDGEDCGSLGLSDHLVRSYVSVGSSSTALRLQSRMVDWYHRSCEH